MRLRECRLRHVRELQHSIRMLFASQLNLPFAEFYRPVDAEREDWLSGAGRQSARHLARRLHDDVRANRHVSEPRGAAGDTAGDVRTMEVKAFDAWARGQDHCLERRQAQETTMNPDFWIYVV